MSISFEDSLKTSREIRENSVPIREIQDKPSLVSDIMETSVDDGNWRKPSNSTLYTYYGSGSFNYEYGESEYFDSQLSIVDSKKNISLSSEQINLTQEKNSQYIPFEIPRYYDGFDLSKTQLSIYWVNKNSQGGLTLPVDVYYSDDRIRFAWLVDDDVTAVAGKIQFEIQASGTNSQGFSYLWKTKPNDGLNVLQSLEIKSFIEPDETWQDSFIDKLSTQATRAENAANLAQSYVADAENAVSTASGFAEQAEGALVDVRNLVLELENGISDEVTAAVDATVGDVIDTKLNDTLVDYYTQSETDTKIKEVIESIPEVDLSDYYTKTEADIKIQQVVDAIPDVDLSGYYTKIEADKRVTDSLQNYATKDDVANMISAEDITDKLNNYYTKTESYSKEEIDSALENVSVDLSDYAEKTYVDNKVETNSENIISLSKTVSEMQEKVESVDTSPRLTYDVVYNDVDNPEIGENGFGFYEIKNEGQSNEERSLKQKFTIVGGSGGGTTSSILKIGYITTSPFIITVDDTAIIKYNFSGTDSSGDNVTEGKATWRLSGKVVATNTAIAGENSFDITEYLSIGTQKVSLTITDDAGSLATKSWTVQKVDVRLESGFNDKLTYPLDRIAFDYTPYGSITKDVHFKLDNVEIGKITTASSGIPMSYELPAQSHGSHLLEAYMTANINGSIIESNHILKDIIWYDSASEVPVISASCQKFTARQYDTTNIEYTVYDPKTETPTVQISVDDEVVSTLKLTENTAIYQYKTDLIGSHTITITCGETVKTIVATITELDIDISPVMAGLVFDFNPSGHSNNDSDRLWSYGDISMSVSDNFDWVNGGYQIDENGDQYFGIKSGTYATISHQLFADDAKKTGKEFKVVFKTENIKTRDTSFISCMNDGIGLDMKVESANIYSSNGSLYSPYCEDDIIEFEFNINKNTDIPMVLTYEDGVGNRPMIYSSDSSFWQTSPQPIKIGSDDCDVRIYRMKAYSSSLNDRNILSNFIADARNADEMISRYERNQIYNENGSLTPEILAEKCPDLRVIIVDAPWFTNDKSDKVEDTTVTMIYKNGDPVLDNWTCTGALHSGQGTSSNEYGYSGRNLDLIMNKSGTVFTLGDGETTAKTITLTRDSVPTNYLNIKVNIASSENENNAQLTNRYNDYNPFVRTAKLKDSKVRDSMEFHNCVVFIRERDENISNHREFADTNVHFYAIGNVGDSKKTDNTRMNDASDPKEFTIEITDYNMPLSEFPTGYTDSYGNKTICPVSEWKIGNSAYDALYAPYKYKDGEFESFGSESYEFRYEMKDISAEQREVNINAWREAYKFIVTSDDEMFKSNFDKYFVKESIFYYYLFTERYLLVDNRAKNCFVHYGKTWYTETEAATFKETYGTEIDAKYIDDVQATFNDGYRFDLSQGYDFDTCLGIDNTGKLVLTYGKEDTDYYIDGDPKSAYIYRAAESTFFTRVRDLFPTELQALFVDRESLNAWSAEGLISQWDKMQSQFPEELWRLDIQRKYLRTYQGISIDNSIAGTANPRFLTEMLNGRKKYQRRMFERNQELYMATKYFGNRATSEQIMMRFNNPVGASIKPNFTLKITPYSDMYIAYSFSSASKQNIRAKAGIEYTIPYSGDTADITLIYGASFIQAIGDLSKCYVGDNDFSKASRLKSLTIGSDVNGYENTYMTKISLGNNKLLEYLDIKNITGLNSAIDLSKCDNLLEIYADGSGATGFIFANGGKLKKGHIPAVTSLTMKNLNYIEEFQIENYSNLKTLTIENTPFMDSYEIVENSSILQALRLVGVDWTLTDKHILDKILSLRGIGNDGSEIAQSVLMGSVSLPIIGQQDLYKYQFAWSDLIISPSTIIQQFKVTFVNDNGEILDEQYVDIGKDAVDPITREHSPISTPMKESTAQYHFTFKGWDDSLTAIFSERTITATYTETLRSYSIKYVAKGTTMQESNGFYGDNVVYEKEIPIYTAEEGNFKFYLFNRWDKSGFIYGDKIINAVFDEFQYIDGYFADKEFSELTPVEIYALTKLGLDKVSHNLEDGNEYSFEMGYDIDYDDIESQELITEKTVFDGSNYIDTEIQLFDEDKDFVLAIDYEMSSENALNNVLAQCFQSNGKNGFQLLYNSGVKFKWGVSSCAPSSANKREMIVIRHQKGSNVLHVYNSHLDTTESTTVDLTANKSFTSNSTLVFGCAKMDDGAYENHAIGTIHWAKIWYKDLGEKTCENLVSWTHEKITAEICGFKKYWLTENASKRCSFSLLATHLLERKRQYNTTNTTAGGWANSTLNAFLNDRFYNGFPPQIRGLLKQVTVSSSVGNRSSELSTSECFIYLPALVEMTNKAPANNEPYISEGFTISYMTTDAMRKRAYDTSDYADYWLRSPNAEYEKYVYTIDSNGQPSGYTNASGILGVLVEFSF